MRSTLTTLAVGFILGATLGFTGLWTQVIQPAQAQIQQLEQEQSIMQSAMDAASEALSKAATELRAEADLTIAPGTQAAIGGGPTPLPTPQPVQPTQPTPQPVQPETNNTARSTRTATRTREVAGELESLATKLRESRKRNR